MQKASGEQRDEWQTVKTYLLLESEGDTSDGALGDSLHQVGGVTGNLVSESLGLDLSDVVDDSLVNMEVVGQPEHKHAKLVMAHDKTVCE